MSELTCVAFNAKLPSMLDVPIVVAPRHIHGYPIGSALCVAKLPFLYSLQMPLLYSLLLVPLLLLMRQPGPIVGRTLVEGDSREEGRGGEVVIGGIVSTARHRMQHVFIDHM